MTNQPYETRTPGTTATGRSRLVLTASSLTDDSVQNAAGENLGDIKDLMIDTASGEIQYAVLSFGGWLGMGEKLFAVPWKAFHVDTADHCLVLDVPKERLKDAPGFDKDNWPDFADNSIASQISNYYH